MSTNDKLIDKIIHLGACGSIQRRDLDEEYFDVLCRFCAGVVSFRIPWHRTPLTESYVLFLKKCSSLFCFAIGVAGFFSLPFPCTSTSHIFLYCFIKRQCEVFARQSDSWRCFLKATNAENWSSRK